MGTAQRLTHRYGQDFYSVDRWGKWLQWDGRQWDLENIRAIEDLRDRSCDKTSACF
jgi:D5 N terminal like